jgi:alcohol dehydrogenase (cytochrome c)
LEGVEYDPDAPVVASAEQAARLANLPPVTDDMLRNPSPEDWLSWGRTYDGHGYSPLKQINKDNVGQLTSAWRVSLRDGVSMPTPVVHAGIMYLHTFPDTVLALDATNGNVLWRYQYQLESPSSQKMGLALHGNKVLVPTSNLHVLALDARTGELIWDHAIEPEFKGPSRIGYQLRSAPLVVKNKVIQGVTASFVPRGGFILAIDVESGKEEWRFHTIARPGEPGGDTWNDLPLDKRSGGSVWDQGSYDPELNLIYFGIAPTYDTGPLLHRVEKEGVSNDTLYTNCTVALDADTGKLVWHYQHMANDQWDLDWVFERQIANVNVNGEMRKVVMNVGKMAILEALDAATGEYLFSVDAGLQNVITHIDPKTGAKTIDPERLPDPSRPCIVAPSAIGARAWPPTSYNPEMGLLYLPLTESAMRMGKGGIPLLTSGVGISFAANYPDFEDGKLGRLQALDVAGQTLGWTYEQVSPMSTSALATAGGLVFCGDMDPSLKAFDAASGKLLWQSALDDMPNSTLATYAVDGKQYVAVIAGMKNFHIDGLFMVIRGSGIKYPEEGKTVPKGGGAIWAFALGD